MHIPNAGSGHSGLEPSPLGPAHTGLGALGKFQASVFSICKRTVATIPIPRTVLAVFGEVQGSFSLFKLGLE